MGSTLEFFPFWKTKVSQSFCLIFPSKPWLNGRRERYTERSKTITTRLSITITSFNAPMINILNTKHGSGNNRSSRSSGQRGWSFFVVMFISLFHALEPFIELKKSKIGAATPNACWALMLQPSCWWFPRTAGALGPTLKLHRYHE